MYLIYLSSHTAVFAFYNLKVARSVFLLILVLYRKELLHLKYSTCFYWLSLKLQYVLAFFDNVLADSLSHVYI